MIIFRFIASALAPLTLLALAHFADQPQTALPGALFAVWCIVTAAGATAWFRRRGALLVEESTA